MASHIERRSQDEDTIVVDADAHAAHANEWPVSDLYRVEADDDPPTDLSADEETVVLEPAASRNRPRSVGIGLLALVLALALAAAYAAVLLAGRDDVESARGAAGGASTTTLPPSTEEAPPSSAISVPNVEGTTAAEARKRLDELGLRVRVRTVESDRPRGLVLRQEPAQGTQATRGDTVALVVSSGIASAAPTTLDVPSVVGLPASKAAARLREDGFAARIRLVGSMKPAGIVVAQSPSGDAMAARGAAVRLDVSKPRSVPPQVAVPDLVGLDVDDARRRLESLGLAVTVNRAASPEPLGTVLRQSPRAGSRLSEDGRVTLTVSSGPEMLDVPDVTGLDEQSARSRLETAGFEVTVTYEPTSDPAADGLVDRQTPAGGAAGAEGSVVTIVVMQLG